MDKYNISKYRMNGYKHLLILKNIFNVTIYVASIYNIIGNIILKFGDKHICIYLYQSYYIYVICSSTYFVEYSNINSFNNIHIVITLSIGISKSNNSNTNKII